jgi:hypothetical protein
MEEQQSYDYQLVLQELVAMQGKLSALKDKHPNDQTLGKEVRKYIRAMENRQ